MLNKLRALSAVLCLVIAGATPAAAQAPKSTLTANVGQDFPDNFIGAITPAVLRAFLNNLIPSFQQYAAVNAQVGTTYSVQGSDYGQLITFNNAASIAVTIPSPTLVAGFYPFSFYASNVGAGTATLTPTSGTINGSASFAISQGNSAFIIADGTNWQVVSFAVGSGNVSNSGTPTVNQFGVWVTATTLKGVSITGLVKGNGASAPAAATAGTDYLAPPSGTALLKANSGGALANATAGTDYVAPGTATVFTATQTFAEVLGTVTAQSGTTYTFAATDCGTEVTFSNAGTVTATIPQTLPTGCNISVLQLGAGKVNVNGSAVTPATLHSAHSFTGTAAQYAIIGINIEAAGTPAIAILTGDGS
jgi:hypothetical protein